VLRPEVRTIRRSLALAKFFHRSADVQWAISRTPIPQSDWPPLS